MRINDELWQHLENYAYTDCGEESRRFVEGLCSHEDALPMLCDIALGKLKLDPLHEDNEVRLGAAFAMERFGDGQLRAVEDALILLLTDWTGIGESAITMVARLRSRRAIDVLQSIVENVGWGGRCKTAREAIETIRGS